MREGTGHQDRMNSGHSPGPRSKLAHMKALPMRIEENPGPENASISADANQLAGPLPPLTRWATPPPWGSNRVSPHPRNAPMLKGTDNTDADSTRDGVTGSTSSIHFRDPVNEPHKIFPRLPSTRETGPDGRLVSSPSPQQEHDKLPFSLHDASIDSESETPEEPSSQDKGPKAPVIGPEVAQMPTAQQLAEFCRRTRARNYEDDKLEDPDPAPALCGSFSMETNRHGIEASAEEAKFLIVPHGGKDGFCNVHLMRYFIENCWSLPRPEVIISVTGGAQHFDLPAVDKEKILRGIMEGTRHLSPWFVTGGTDSGIMKFVGEARTKYNPTAPLIGISSLGAINGGIHLREMCNVTAPGNPDAEYTYKDEWKWDKKEGFWWHETETKGAGKPRRKKTKHGHLSYDNLKTMTHNEIESSDAKDMKVSSDGDGSTPHAANQDKDAVKKALKETLPCALDKNHSHFFLIDDGRSNGIAAFGPDTELRGWFESCVADASEDKYPVCKLRFEPRAEQYGFWPDDYSEYYFARLPKGTKLEQWTSQIKDFVKDIVKEKVGQEMPVKDVKVRTIMKGQDKDGDYEEVEIEIPGSWASKVHLDMVHNDVSDTAQFDDVLVESAWVAGASSALQAVFIWCQGWGNTFSSYACEDFDATAESRESHVGQIHNLKKKLSGIPGDKGSENSRGKYSNQVYAKRLQKDIERLEEANDANSIARVWECDDDRDRSGWREVSHISRSEDRLVCSALQAIWLQNANCTPEQADACFKQAQVLNDRITDERKKGESEEMKRYRESLKTEEQFRDENSIKDQDRNKRGKYDSTRKIQRHIAITKSHTAGMLLSTVGAAELVGIPKLLDQLSTHNAELEAVNHDLKAIYKNLASDNIKAQTRLRKIVDKKQQLKLRIERLKKRNVVVRVEGRESKVEGRENVGDKKILYVRCKLENLSRLSALQIQQELSKKLHCCTWNTSSKGAKSKGNGDGDEDDENDDLKVEQDTKNFESSSVPLVSVCVQGGKGTVDTVRAAVENGTPVLVLRGSGKAADLISDAVMLQYAPSHTAHTKHRNPEQRKFWSLLQLCGINQDSIDDTDLYDWNIAIRRLSESIEYLKQLGDFHIEDESQIDGILGQFMLIWDSARALVKDVYQVAPEKTEDKQCLNLIIDALKCAKSRKCWVYDLHSKEPGYDDFNGALLKCLLNGVSRVGEENETTLWTKLKYSMLWSREDIMNYILLRMSTNIDHSRLKKIYDKAILFALTRDKQHALQSLLERGSSLGTLDVGSGFCFVKHHLNVTKEEDDRQLKAVMSNHAQQYFNAAKNWKALIDEALVRNPKFSLLWTEYKLLCKDHHTNYFARIKQTILPRSYSSRQKNLTEKYHPVLKEAGHPIPESMRLALYSFVSQRRKETKEKFEELRDHQNKKLENQNKKLENQKSKLGDSGISGQPDSDLPQLSGSRKSSGGLFGVTVQVQKAKTRFKKKQGGKSRRPHSEELEESQERESLKDTYMKKKLSSHIILLEGLYIHLMGPNFRYRMGVLGPELDLFLWNVLQQKLDLAKAMWRHVRHPVRSAISAAFLSRQLAKDEHTDAISKQELLNNADDFENLAIDVQNAAVEDNRDMAIKSVDAELYLFRGMSLLDVAVLSESNRFIETECCTQAIRFRFYGDLLPTQFDTGWGKSKFVFSVISFGLLPTFVPKFLEWTPPPENEVLRRRTQRRKTPPGYPNRPSQNDILQQLHAKPQEIKVKSKQDFRNPNKRLLLRLLTKYRDVDIKDDDLTAEEMNVLWAPTFHWLERFKCFFSAPCVLFVYNAIVTLSVTVILTAWFLDKNVRPHKQPQAWMMYYSHAFFGSSLFRELMQLLLLTVLRSERIFSSRKSFVEGGLKTIIPYYEGLAEYFDLWNLIDVLSPLCWFVGFDLERRCIGSNMQDSQCRIPDVEGFGSAPYALSNVFYAFCIFLCFCRVLRIFYVTNIGNVINIFLHNFREFFQFLIIYVVLLLGFSMLFIGFAGDVTSIVPDTCSSWKPADSTESLLENAGANADSGLLSCIESYWIIRPLFQSFGEFALKEITNVPSLLILIFTFMVLNLMLINLFIAMMAATFEKMQLRASTLLLLYKYALLEEHSRTAISVPVFFTVPAFLLDLILYFRVRHSVQDQYPDATPLQRFDLFLSRNTTFNPEAGDDIETLDEDHHKHQARLSAFMERARAECLNKVHPKDSLDGKVGAILSSCEHMQVMQETIRTHVVQPGSKNLREKSAGMMSAGRREELKTKFQTQASFVGKKAMSVKKWKNYHGKSKDTLDIGFSQDNYNDPLNMFQRTGTSNKNFRAVRLDSGWDFDEDEVGFLKDELKALKTMNSRLLSLLDPKTARGLMDWQKFEHDEKPEEKFRSALQAIMFSSKIRYGQEDEECVNDNNQDLCEECRHSVRDHARWICRDCKTFLCDSCKMNHDRNKHRTTRLEQQSSSN